MDITRENWLIVSATASSMSHGGQNLETFVMGLRRLLQEGQWRKYSWPNGEVVHFERFADFIVDSRGLDTTVERVRDLIQRDVELVDLLDRELQGKQGGRTDLVNNVNEVPRPEGNARATALRKLRKDAPDLHAQVLAEKISAHAAMVQAGFRPRTLSVRLDDPISIARSLHKNLPVADFADLATEVQQLLVHRDDDP